MTQLDQFRTIHNTALIGFDDLFRRIKELESPKSNFPPYDIIKKSDELFIIRLAVAGYSKDDISVTLDSGRLVVVGSINSESLTDKEKYPEYLYKGISQRNFKREFGLVDTVEVSKVFLSEGMLSIELINVIPEHKKPKTFQIL